MDRRMLNFLLKMGVIIAAYIVASRYMEEQYILYAAIGIAFLYIVYQIGAKKEPMDELYRYCSLINYYRKTNKAFRNNETAFNVYMAYGKLYEGLLEESDLYLKKLDVDYLQEDEELYHLYLQTILRIEYEKKNIEYLDSLFKMLLSNEVIHPNTIKITKVMILLLEERYEEALTELLNVIPKEDRRHVIMELEVYLAEVYLAMNQEEDAKAVLEFVASKKFDTVHVTKAKSMLVNKE